MSTHTNHIPVLLEEVIRHIGNIEGGVFIDGTFGGGGYTRALLEAGAKKVIAIDQDPKAIERGSALKEEFGERLSLNNCTFSQMAHVAQQQKMETVNGIVLDLGFSSDQLDDIQRGISFKSDGPLDMRMGTGPLTAANVLNEWEEKELADMIYMYGEERKSRQIAKKIVDRRREKQFETTNELKELVEEVIPVWKGKGRHPAMRTFQALRICVNRELEELENVLPEAAELLSVGGRLGIVSFHSLEDRMVKHFFRERAGGAAHLRSKKFHERATVLPLPEQEGGECEGVKTFALPFKKPVEPSVEEVSHNTRARSAKLRVLERKT